MDADYQKEPGEFSSDQADQADKVGESPLTYLDQALWQQLSAAPSPAAFAKAWLTLQCAMISGVRRALVLQPTTLGGKPVPVGRWPDSDAGDLSALSEIAEIAAGRGRGVAKELQDAALVGYPFIHDELTSGVVALEIEPRSQAELRVVMRQLQWGGAWMRAVMQEGVPQAGSPSQKRLVTVLEQVATSLEHTSFKAASGAVVTDAATVLDCERVSIGFVSSNHVDPQAISHSADFGKRSNLVRAIGAVMDEAIDQRETLLYPPTDPDDVHTTIASAALSEEGQGMQVCTVPFLVDGEFSGAWTFEKTAGRPFDACTVQLLQYLASVVGPILELKRREEFWIGSKVAAAGRRQLERAVGPGYVGRKTFAVLAALLTLFFAIYDTTFRVGADASLEGQIQRVIAAPMDSYIGEVNARAGDLVGDGDLMLTLDDRDLRLEQIKWETRKAQLERSRQDALSRKERAESRIYKAQADQADAELQLLSAQLARTLIRAPFDGIVVSGDLSQKLGAPVERGEILMEVAPLDAYRVAIAIDERDIRHLVVGQAGELILPSVPNETFAFTVTKITPVATAEQGKNTFRVEADLLEPSEALRPGMEGTAKIEAGERRLIWIWTRRFSEWFRVWVWSWWY
jgi:RND family efflux transporter MFP subunit